MNNKDNLKKVIKRSKEIFIDNLKNDNKAIEYLANRGVSTADAEKYGVGFSGNYLKTLKDEGFDESLLMNAGLMSSRGTQVFNNRIMFSINNKSGIPVAFSGRVIKDVENSPKYINSAESLIFKKRMTLYNMDNAKKSDDIFVLEGFMDVIAMEKAGIKGSVAAMGTSIAQESIKYLKNKNVVLGFDGDEPGKKAALKTLQRLIANNIYPSFVKFPKDASEMYMSSGVDSIKLEIDNKLTIEDYLTDHVEEKYNFDSIDEIQSMVTEISSLICENEHIAVGIAINLTEKSGLSVETLTNVFLNNSQGDSKSNQR